MHVRKIKTKQPWVHAVLISIRGSSFSLRIAIVSMKAHYPLVSSLVESFYGIGTEKNDVVCKKIKNLKNVWNFLFVVKADNEE